MARHWRRGVRKKVGRQVVQVLGERQVEHGLGQGRQLGWRGDTGVEFGVLTDGEYS